MENNPVITTRSEKMKERREKLHQIQVLQELLRIFQNFASSVL